MERLYFVIDAFASQPFTGNPAAVVLDTDGLADGEMQAAASEFNLSETTFVLPPTVPDQPGNLDSGAAPDLSLRFRWFTPAIEVKMCGHATIAGVHALLESGRLNLAKGSESATVRIETLSGVLTAIVEPIPGDDSKRMIWLDMIDPTFSPISLTKTELAPLLGLAIEAFDPMLPLVATQDRDALVFVRDFHALNEAAPDFTRLGTRMEREDLRGLSLATVKTLTPSISLQSRFFAPAAGIDEDPVTGSVHGPLAAYLVKHGLVPLHDGLAGMMCTQGKPGGRAGLVHALVQEKGGGRYGVRIGGTAVTITRGTLYL